MESGTYKGFFDTALGMFKQHTKIPSTNIFPWRVFTPKDFLLAKKTFSSNKGKI